MNMGRFFLVICRMLNKQLCKMPLLCSCRRLGAFAMHTKHQTVVADDAEAAFMRCRADGIDVRV